MKAKKSKPVLIRIIHAMDGRKNQWLQRKLAEKGIILTSPQLSQRLNGNAKFTGDEAIACFEILGIDTVEEKEETING